MAVRPALLEKMRRYAASAGTTTLCTNAEDAEFARGCDDAGADVPESIAIAARGNGGHELQGVGRFEIGLPRRMHVQHQHHGCRLRAFVDDVEADFDLHGRGLK